MLIKKYSSSWVKDFENIKSEIDKGLNGLKYKIEHVGSTSVPNLDSKPIIDIDVIYNSEADFNLIKLRLTQIGYYHNGNQGIEKRDVFKRNGKFFHDVLDIITHHLYVCQKDSEALERHILMRNYLRKNEWARQEYQKMKFELAEKANHDKKTYAYLKELHLNDFINEIIIKEKTKHQ